MTAWLTVCFAKSAVFASAANVRHERLTCVSQLFARNTKPQTAFIYFYLLRARHERVPTYGVCLCCGECDMRQRSAVAYDIDPCNDTTAR